MQDFGGAKRVPLHAEEQNTSGLVIYGDKRAVVAGPIAAAEGLRHGSAGGDVNSAVLERGLRIRRGRCTG